MLSQSLHAERIPSLPHLCQCSTAVRLNKGLMQLCHKPLAFVLSSPFSKEASSILIQSYVQIKLLIYLRGFTVSTIAGSLCQPAPPTDNNDQLGIKYLKNIKFQTAYSNPKQAETGKYPTPEEGSWIFQDLFFFTALPREQTVCGSLWVQELMLVTAMLAQFHRCSWRLPECLDNKRGRAEKKAATEGGCYARNSPSDLHYVSLYK